MILFWPLTALLFSTYRRRYHAALIVLLGQQTFEKLSPQDRIRVDEDVDENWRGTDTPVVAYRKLIPPTTMRRSSCKNKGWSWRICRFPTLAVISDT